MNKLPHDTDTITRDELKATLDRGAALRLVMLHGKAAFDTLHIPGSVFATSLPEAMAMLSHDDDIVVYTASEECRRGWVVQRLLSARGYHRVRQYRGGLADWEAAGYPLAGELAAARPALQPVGV